MVHVRRHDGRGRRPTTVSLLIVAVIVLSLFGAGAFAWWGWQLVGAEAPSGIVLPVVLGVAATLIIGCGLMALMFYSSRHGYDRNVTRDTTGDGRGR